MNPVVNNLARSRYEVIEDGKLVFADYRRHGTVVTLLHVEADPELRGRGSAGRLMAGVCDMARGEGLKIRATCGYAASYFEKNPRHHDLIG